MATQVPTNSEPGVGSLLKGIVDDLGNLIKQQFQFARTEVKTDLRKSKTAGVILASGAGIATVGAFFLGLMLVHLLHFLSGNVDTASLPLWSCYAIVGILFLAVGAIAIQMGLKKFDSFNPLPDQTVESMKETLEWQTTNSKPTPN